MSKESVQFAEMVRLEHAKLLARNRGLLDPSKPVHDGNLYEVWCEVCGECTGHWLEDAGRDEVYHCSMCGTSVSYRVR